MAGLRRPRVQIARSTLQAVELLRVETGEVAIGDCVLKLRVDGAAIGELNLTNCAGAVEAEGTIGSIAAVGGKLELSDRSTAQSLSFDAVELRLRAQGSKGVKFHTVTGHAELGPATLDAVRSELTLALSGLTGGSVSDSFIELSLDGWECLAAELTRRSSLSAVAGRHRVFRPPGGEPARSRRMRPLGQTPSLFSIRRSRSIGGGSASTGW